MKIKFRDMPLGGRFDDYGSVYVVIQCYGDGLVAKECLNPSERIWQSLCCFVDAEEGITLDTEVNFIGLEKGGNNK